MELVYKYGNEDLFNIKDQATEYRRELHWNDNEPLPNTIEDVNKFVRLQCNQDLTYFQNSLHVYSHCQHNSYNIEEFHAGKSNIHKKSAADIPEVPVKLKTFKTIAEREAKKEHDFFGHWVYSNQLLKSKFPSSKKDLKPFEDVVISIRCYQPFGYVHSYRGSGPNFANEFLVLGSQKLTDMRDKMKCRNNGSSKNVSENFETQTAPNKSNPGFFFITDTFYNDTRKPRKTDYSSAIITWAKTRRGLSSVIFNEKRMEETRFEDVSVRLGVPQIYQHRGNCEHLFTFASVRLLSPDDHLLRKDYPIKRSNSLSKPTPCNTCGKRESTHIIMKSNRHLHGITYLCYTCLNYYHYIDGNKIGEFELYDLNDEEMLNFPVNNVTQITK